ncbi:MAG: hypothetical protein JNJ63_11125 [Hyphomonadaceae bacterium]|nr:hypothetical protein [Hyphomonadaceae bacterium]
MTEQEALDIADTPAWWMGPDGPRQAMRTLRAALNDMAAHEGRAFLFRPGGFGAAAIWLCSDQISALRTLLGADPAAGRDRAAQSGRAA